MRKIVALLLVLIFLESSCAILAKPAWSSTEVTENSWTTKTPMPTARAYPGVAAVNGKIYAIGGDVGSIIAEGVNAEYFFTGNVTNVNEEYDPVTDTWMLKASMPTPRARFGVAVVEDKIYCIGGLPTSGGTTANEVYDPTNNSWSSKAPMPNSLYPVVVTVADDKIYVMSADYKGGRESPQVYDPLTDSWTLKSAPPNEIMSWTATALDGRIYLLGNRWL